MNRFPSMPSCFDGWRVGALVGAAVMWFAQGELERARTALDRALRLASAGDMDIVADAEYAFGQVERAAEVNAARDRVH